jgi:hypothetical protein
VKFVTVLIGMRRMSNAKITLKKKLHNKLKRIVQVKGMGKMKRRKKHLQSSNFWK